MSLWATQTGIRKILSASFWLWSFQKNSEFGPKISLTKTAATTFREPKQFHWTSLWANPIKLEPYAYTWMFIKMYQQFNMKCNQKKDFSFLNEIQIIFRFHLCLCRSIACDDQVCNVFLRPFRNITIQYYLLFNICFLEENNMI